MSPLEILSEGLYSNEPVSSTAELSQYTEISFGLDGIILLELKSPPAYDVAIANSPYPLWWFKG